LEPHDVEFRIQIPDQNVAGCPSIGRFRYLDSRISVGAVLKGCSCRGHHVDIVVLNSRVPVDTAPDLRVVFDGILIKRHS
jgi:hypothetical protein